MSRLSRYKLRVWSVRVRWRDRKCALCGGRSGLQAHHINDKSNHPEEAYELDNGITLCNGSKSEFKCHSIFHNLFKGGYRRKTSHKDYQRFMILVKAIRDIPFDTEVPTDHR